MKIFYSSTSVAESDIFCLVRRCLRAHESPRNQCIYNIFFVCRCVPCHMCLRSFPITISYVVIFPFFTVIYNRIFSSLNFHLVCRSSNNPSAPFFLVSLVSCFNLLPLRYFIHCAPLYLPYKSRHSDFFFCFIFFSGDFLFICRTRS